jgi:hypothetical protein
MGGLGKIQNFDASAAGEISRAVEICVTIFLESSLFVAELRP